MAQTPQIKAWLEAMGMTIEDVERVWILKANKNGRMNIQQLTQGIAKLEGEARNMDLLALAHEFREFNNSQGFHNYGGGRDSVGPYDRSSLNQMAEERRYSLFEEPTQKESSEQVEI